MARTATRGGGRKAVGGPAPRHKLPSRAGGHAAARAVAQAQKRSIPIIKKVDVDAQVGIKPNANSFRSHKYANDDYFCSGCGCGGDMTACSIDSKGVCGACIPQLALFVRSPEEVREAVDFTCPSCFTRLTPKVPYVALKSKSGEPFYNTPTVLGPSYIFRDFRVAAPIVAIIDLYCTTEKRFRSISTSIETDLVFATNVEDRLVHKWRVGFDLSTDEGIETHEKSMEALRRKIEEEKIEVVVLVIWTHSVTEGANVGDLWGGKDFGLRPADFFRGVVTDPLVDVLAQKRTHVVVNACGETFTTPAAAEEWRIFASRLRVESFIGFTATQLDISHADPFIRYVLKRMICGAREPKRALNDGLKASGMLGRYSGIVHMTVDEDAKELIRRTPIWAHDRIRPLGATLPRQCPSCMGLFTFDKVDLLAMTARCTGTVLNPNGGMGTKCNNLYSFTPAIDPDPKAEYTIDAEGGQWHVREECFQLDF